MTFYHDKAAPDRRPNDEDRDRSKGTPSGEDTPSTHYDGTSVAVNPSARRPYIDSPRENKHPATKLNLTEVENAAGSAMVIPEVGGEFEYQNKADRGPGKQSRYGATLEDIAQGVAQAIVERSQEYTPQLQRVDTRNRMWTFKVGKWQVKVRVKTRDKRVKKAISADVDLTCSCPFWRWQGPEHWGQSEDYLYKDPRGTASFPQVRDPRHEKPVCKHVYAVFQVLKGYDIPGTRRASGTGPNLLEVVHQAALGGTLSVSHEDTYQIAVEVADQYMRRM